jgi:hypothetical protein
MAMEHARKKVLPSLLDTLPFPIVITRFADGVVLAINWGSCAKSGNGTTICR